MHRYAIIFVSTLLYLVTADYPRIIVPPFFPSLESLNLTDAQLYAMSMPPFKYDTASANFETSCIHEEEALVSPTLSHIGSDSRIGNTQTRVDDLRHCYKYIMHFGHKQCSVPSSRHTKKVQFCGTLSGTKVVGLDNARSGRGVSIWCEHVAMGLEAIFSRCERADQVRSRYIFQSSRFVT